MSYTILPLRFMRWSPSEVFLTNEVGEYVFLSNDKALTIRFLLTLSVN